MYGKSVRPGIGWCILQIVIAISFISCKKAGEISAGGMSCVKVVIACYCGTVYLYPWRFTGSILGIGSIYWPRGRWPTTDIIRINTYQFQVERLCTHTIPISQARGAVGIVPDGKCASIRIGTGKFSPGRATGKHNDGIEPQNRDG